MMKAEQRIPTRRAQQGLSLVELMVSLTIGIFLLGAVGIIYVNTTTTSRSSTLESQMNEDATLALELLQQQIRLTGFSNVDGGGNRLFPGQAIRGCDGGFADTDAAFLDPATPPLLTCNGGAGPDALAVRYEASLLNSQTVNDAGVPRPGNCVHEGIQAWNAQTEGAGSATPMLLADNRYYIANDNGTPSLVCQGRTGTGFGIATALIPNIEDMQIQYAVTELPRLGSPIPHQVNGYVNASDATASTLAVDSLVIRPGTPATINNWSRVAAVRICLLARSAAPVPPGNNPLGTANPDGTTLVPGLGTYVDCNGISRTVIDRRLRRAYVTTIQLRNMRPGLPADYAAGEYAWQYMYDN